ncbi:hypothetical protein HOLleu_18653 [Holothuria leucospilota]|uniref:Uncharacterized protein n=1 Tax=Holothuria leucospilota TaxID=206669 RepID=A0A9Q1C256_HOLLE|nr:hypothetical protein HOLleu_18653 [Holothuria leucospilota]
MTEEGCAELCSHEVYRPPLSLRVETPFGATLYYAYIISYAFVEIWKTARTLRPYAVLSVCQQQKVNVKRIITICLFMKLLHHRLFGFKNWNQAEKTVRQPFTVISGLQTAHRQGRRAKKQLAS